MPTTDRAVTLTPARSEGARALRAATTAAQAIRFALAHVSLVEDVKSQQEQDLESRVVMKC